MSVAVGVMIAALEPAPISLLIGAAVVGLSAALVRPFGWTSRAGALRTATALAALGVIAVTWNGLPRPAFATSLAPFDLAFLAALFALAFALLRGVLALRLPGWFVLAAVGMVAAALITALFAAETAESVVGRGSGYLVDVGRRKAGGDSDLTGILRLEFAFFAVPVLIAALASSWRRATLIVDLWLASASVSAAVALLDLFAGTGISGSVTGVLWKKGQEAGLAIHPTHLALSCGMALPVALARASSLQGLRAWLAIPASVLLVGGMLSSASRVGLIAVPLAVALSMLLFPGRRWKLLAGLVIGVVVAWVGATLVLGRLPTFLGEQRLRGTPRAAASTEGHVNQLAASVANIESHPLTGIGFRLSRDAHDIYLQFLEAGGPVALIAFAVFIWGALRLGWRLSRDHSRVPWESRQLAGALTAGLGVWLISGVLQSPITDRYIYIPFGVLLGLWVTAGKVRSDAPGDDLPTTREPPPLPAES